MKRIGLVVNGGDAPGINAAIEAAAYTLTAYGAEAWGVQGGIGGLLAGNAQRLTGGEWHGKSAQGGTLLSTSRDRMLVEPDTRARLQRVWAEAALDGLILFGGDGTIRRAAALLVDWDIRLVAVPCTIDGDVPRTELTLGFDSACNRALPMIDAIRDTATSLVGRIFVVETLGGDTGHLALAIAYATRADAVLIPEIAFDMPQVARNLQAAVTRQGYALCIVGEGIGNVPDLCTGLALATGHRVRLTTLGHAQRGGSPSYFDRWLGRAWGERAALDLLGGRCCSMVAWQAGQVNAVSIHDVAVAPPKEIDRLGYTLVNREGQFYAAK